MKKTLAIAGILALSITPTASFACDLTDASLTDADLTDADLRGANLISAYVTRVFQ